MRRRRRRRRRRGPPPRAVQEIQTETERLVGVNKGVSDKPIRLKIFSPNVL